MNLEDRTMPSRNPTQRQSAEILGHINSSIIQRICFCLPAATDGRGIHIMWGIPDTANQSQRIDLMAFNQSSLSFYPQQSCGYSLELQTAVGPTFPTPGPSAAPAELSGSPRQIKEMRMGELSVSKPPQTPAGFP